MRLQKHLYKILKNIDEDKSEYELLILVENICFLIRARSAKFKSEDVTVPIAERKTQDEDVVETKIAIVVHDTNKHSFDTIVSAISDGDVLSELEDKVDALVFEALKEAE